MLGAICFRALFKWLWAADVPVLKYLGWNAILSICIGAVLWEWLEYAFGGVNDAKPCAFGDGWITKKLRWWLDTIGDVIGAVGITLIAELPRWIAE